MALISLFLSINGSKIASTSKRLKIKSMYQENSLKASGNSSLTLIISLMRYLIIDNTPTSSSISKNIMDKQALSFLCKHDKAPQFGAEHASAVDFCRSITQGCVSNVPCLKQFCY